MNLKVDFFDLRHRVAADLDAYRVPELSPDALGEALPPEWYAEHLARMRDALVQPSTARIRDSDPATGELVVVDVVIVVDDGAGGLVAYDSATDEYVLVVRDADRDSARSVDIVSCGIRGDVVGCYLSA
jgi:hypothetical protein